MAAARVGNPAPFVRYAWGSLAFTVAVVLWGAYVRATGSGAGCGAHWPLCDGQVVPRAPRAETVIELTHRLTSGVSLLLVLGLGVWAVRLFPARHRVRRMATAAVLFMLSEALIGAGLVLFGLVADDRSPARAVVLGVHLTNTFFLLAAMALSAWLAGHPVITPPAWRRSPAAWTAMALLAGVLLTGVSGAMVALGDTLFPATSLGHGFAQDTAPDAHALVRLRVWHPLIALLVSIALARFARVQRQRFPWALGTLARLLTAGVSLQLLAGAVNVVLLAPVWLQLVHLLLADLVWVTLVLLVATLLDAEALPARETYDVSAAPTMAAPIGMRSLPKGPG